MVDEFDALVLVLYRAIEAYRAFHYYWDSRMVKRTLPVSFALWIAAYEPSSWLFLHFPVWHEKNILATGLCKVYMRHLSYQKRVSAPLHASGSIDMQLWELPLATGEKET